MVVDSHIIGLDELCKRYNTDLTYGKTQAAANEDIARYGLNRDLCYKTFFGRKLRLFKTSWSVCSWQAFTA